MSPRADSLPVHPDEDAAAAALDLSQAAPPDGAVIASPDEQPASTEPPPARVSLRQRRLLIAGLTVLALLAGLGAIAGSYFYDSIREPGELTLVNSTEI